MRTFIALALLAFSTSAHAINVEWGEWFNVEGLYGAVIDTPSGDVTAFYAGETGGVITGPCINANVDEWAVGDYNGPVNKPVCDRLLLFVGGEKSLTFDAPVDNPYLAFMNWDTVAVLFADPFELISTGTGFYGTGTPILNDDSTGFSGDGPVHAIIRFNGTFSSLSWIDSSTPTINRFLTVGVGDPAQVVPAPASWAMLVGGLSIAGLVGLRRKGTASAR